jgi:hypothetical protein
MARRARLVVEAVNHKEIDPLIAPVRRRRKWAIGLAGSSLRRVENSLEGSIK